MKNILKGGGLVAAGFVLGLLVAPGDKNSSEPVKETAAATTNKETTPTQEVKKVQTKPVVQESMTPVFEDDKVKITFVKNDSDGVKFLAENKTNVNITIQADSVSVNGFSSSNITMSDDVAPQSKGFVTARTSELNDIGTPEKVSGSLKIIDFNKSFQTYKASFTNVSVK